MNNKDLLGNDYEISWPNHDYIYFDAQKNINKLDLLAQLLHAEAASVTNITDDDYGVYFFHNTKTLKCKNCDLVLQYPERVKKIKMGGNTYA